MYCDQTFGWIRMSLGVEVGLGSGDIVLGGDPSPPPRKGAQQPPLFGKCLLRSNSCPSQLLLSTCSCFAGAYSTIAVRMVADVLRLRYDAADGVQHPGSECATLAAVDVLVPTRPSTSEQSSSIQHHWSSTDHRLADLPLHSARHQPLLLLGASSLNAVYTIQPVIQQVVKPV